MASTTTLTLTEDQLQLLLSALESEWTDNMSPEELADHDRMHARLVKAINRLD